MKRAEAKILGLKIYNTGKSCKHGHFADRYTVTGVCINCLLIRSSKWRKENPEKCAESSKKWLQNNRELHNTRVKHWNTVNKEKVYERAKLWVKSNPDKIKAKHVRYIKKHPDAYTARSVASVARRSKRTPKWLTAEDKWMMREAYHLAKLRTHIFGFIWEVDHVLPLRGKFVSGLHVPSNLQVIPKAENRDKRNHYNPS